MFIFHVKIDPGVPEALCWALCTVHPPLFLTIHFVFVCTSVWFGLFFTLYLSLSVVLVQRYQYGSSLTHSWAADVRIMCPNVKQRGGFIFCKQ